MSDDKEEDIEIVEPVPVAGTSIKDVSIAAQVTEEENNIELATNLLGLAQGEFLVLELAPDDKDESQEDAPVEVTVQKEEMSEEQLKVPAIIRRSVTEKKASTSKVKLISMPRPGEEVHRVIEVQLMEMPEEETSAFQEIEVAARSFEDAEKMPVAVRDVDPKMLTKDPSTGMYACKTCNKLFAAKSGLATHVLTHSDIRPYPCPQDECRKSFRTRESCRRHFFSHSGDKAFECEHCKKKFASNQGLKEHVTIHMNTKLYKCGECNKEFRQISSLSRHQTVHNGTKRYCCEICSKGFTQASYLRSHMKSHTGERPYRCDVCQKLYAHRSDLNRHKIIHSGERPYQCDWCGHSFADASSRRRHMRDHNEMRGTYTCHLCNQLFRRFGLLKTHLSRRHNIIEVAQGDSNTLKIIGSDSMDLHEADVATPRAKLIQGQLFQVLCQLRKAKPNTQYQFVHQPKATVSELLNATRQFRDSASGVTVEEQDLAVQLAMNALQAEQNESVLVCEQELPLNHDGSISEHVYLTELPEGVEANAGNLIVNEKGGISYFTIETEVGSGDASKCTEQTEVQLPKGTIVQVGKDYTVVESSSDVAEGNEDVEATEDTESAEEPMDVVEIDENIFQMHYDQQPELDGADYNRWLETFVELCKCWSMPFEVELYEKVTHVHKTLLDALASPKGKLAEKENFEFLTNRCGILGGLITQHLAAVLTNLK